MFAGRLALALAVFGPPLVGVIALIASLVRFRAARARPSIVAAIAAVIVWVSLCAGATLLGVRFVFAYAWMWAHSRQAVSFSEQLAALGTVCGGLLVLIACYALLHRLIRMRSAGARV